MTTRIELLSADHSFGDRWFTVRTVIGAVVAAMLIVIAVAGSHSVRPSQAAFHKTEATEVRAAPRPALRSGTLAAYQNLL